MTRRSGWRRVFRLDVGRDHVERDVDEEIAFHLAMRAEKLKGQGVEDELAGAQARNRFGDLPAIRHELLTIDHGKERAVNRGRFLEYVKRDLAYAIRGLRLHAGFSTVVVLTLALGIGANTAIFSLVDALLLRPIPVSHPEQLVALGDVRRVNSWSAGSQRTDLYSYPLYEDLRDHTTTLSGLYGNGDAGQLDLVSRAPGGVGTAGATPAEADHPRGRFVTANYFHVLGVGAARGRVFTPHEDRVPGGGAVVVISDRYWQREFNRDPAVIGRTVSVNHVPMTIVGVTPPAFTGDIVAQTTDLWMPVSMQEVLQPNRKWLDDRMVSWMLLMGRRKPGVTFAQAHAQLTALIRRMVDRAATAPNTGAATRAQYDNIPITPGGRGFSYWRAAYARSLYTLLIAVGLVLLIVCANVANLLLSRATSRAREIGVRLALGAGRIRLVQQLMIESVTLAVIGAAAGLLVAYWGIALLLHAVSGRGGTLPLDARLSGPVLAFTAALAIGAAVLFGLAPALWATRVDLAGVLRAHSRGISGGWRRFGAARVLVVLQVALSLTMLVATAMVVRSLRALETQNMGLDADHLLVVGVSADKLDLTDAGLIALRAHLSEALAALPGVRRVTYSMDGLFSGVQSEMTIGVPGFVSRTEADSTVNFDAVGPGYFHTKGTRLVRGRDIAPDDGTRLPRAAVVNEAFVKKYVASGDAVGRHFTDGDTDFEIVGVAVDARDHDLRDAPAARVFEAMGGESPGFAFEVRATGDPAALVQPVRRALHAAAPALQVDDDQPLRVRIRSSIRPDILMARFVSGFGVLALLLAAMGLYGIMSYATLRRSGEFGLRLALGAQPGTILRLVLRDALVLMAVGAAAGVPLILIGTRLLRSQLFGITSLDPVSIAFGVAVLGVSAIVAGLLPAWRAARVEPLVALRTE
ncbi:MAG: ADOP family duplicated permease [Gemmatimonadaceae bacterium]